MTLFPGDTNLTTPNQMFSFIGGKLRNTVFSAFCLFKVKFHCKSAKVCVSKILDY